MEDSSSLLPALVIAVAAGAGVWLLRRSWLGKDRKAGAVAAGWLLIAAAAIVPAWVLGPARGPFIAIAIVVLGRWHPVWVLGAALLFGGATALQFLFQAMGLAVPYQLFLMLPYALALVALTGGLGRARAPAGLGRDI